MSSLPVITAFRLLAAKLDARHPILHQGRAAPIENQIENRKFQEALLTASTNIGSLLCDGIGDAILVRGEEAPGQSLRLVLQYSSGGRIADFQNRLCGVSELWTHALQPADDHRAHQGGHLPSQGREDRRDGLHCEWTRRNGGRRFRLCGWRAGQDQPLCQQTAVKFNIPEGRGSGPAEGFDSRARQVGRCPPRRSRQRWSERLDVLGKTLVVLASCLPESGSCSGLGIGEGWLGGLPGDINIERGGMGFHFPIVTCVLAEHSSSRVILAVLATVIDKILLAIPAALMFS